MGRGITIKESYLWRSEMSKIVITLELGKQQVLDLITGLSIGKHAARHLRKGGDIGGHTNQEVSTGVDTSLEWVEGKAIAAYNEEARGQR
jgi:hypothetical protein